MHSENVNDLAMARGALRENLLRSVARFGSFFPRPAPLWTGFFGVALSFGAGAETTTLQWDPADGDPRVAGYEVRYGLESGVYQWVAQADADGGATDRATLDNLASGNQYYISVRSRNSDGSLVSAHSNEVSVTIGSLPDTTAPINPSPGEIVAAYSFEQDQDSKVAVDTSGNRNDGIVSGATRTASDRVGSVGNALDFDGTNDLVDLKTLDISGDGLTISAWMWARDFDTYDARLVSKATGVWENDHYWMVSTFKNNSVRFRLKAGGSTTTLISRSGVIEAGEWRHVAATYDGARMAIYVNGEEVAAKSKSGVIDTDDSVPVAIGNQPQGGRPFDGLIDEVRIYNWALTESDIQTDM